MYRCNLISILASVKNSFHVSLPFLVGGPIAALLFSIQHHFIISGTRKLSPFTNLDCSSFCSCVSGLCLVFNVSTTGVSVLVTSGGVGVGDTESLPSAGCFCWVMCFCRARSFAWISGAWFWSRAWRTTENT